MGTKASEQYLSAAGAATFDSDDGSGVCQGESDGGVTLFTSARDVRTECASTSQSRSLRVRAGLPRPCAEPPVWG
jgi:hypothetical protein